MRVGLYMSLHNKTPSLYTIGLTGSTWKMIHAAMRQRNVGDGRYPFERQKSSPKGRRATSLHPFSSYARNEMRQY